MSTNKTRRATEADRKAALDALERANIPVIDVATDLNTCPDKWSLKHCRAAMIKAGMTDEGIDAAFAGNDPFKAEGQGAEHEDSSTVDNAQEVDAADCEHGSEGQQGITDQDATTETDPVPTDPDDDSKTDAPPDLLSNPHNVRKLGREIIEVEQELTTDERLEVAARMAKALADRDRLELEFSMVKKDFKAKIDLAVSEAAEAGAEYRAGSRKLNVKAVKLEDRTTMEIVFVEPDGAQRELMRRPMTHEERKLPLPLEQSEQTTTPPTIGTTEPTPDNARTCITCASMTQGDAELSEPCQTCSQCGNGDVDNWTPCKECSTCNDSTTRVGLYPCNGCSLNADAEHRGDEDRWTWKEVGKELTKLADGMMDDLSETEAMLIAEEDATSADGSGLESDVPADTESAGDAMPTLDNMPPTMPTAQPDDLPEVRQ